MATRRERLCEALLRHGAAEWGKYGINVWRFSQTNLLRGEVIPAAQRESWAAEDLQQSRIRDRCRELAERLEQAESQETARKRQKLEEETAERRRLEAELQKSQEEGRELRNRLAVAEAQVSGKDAELQAAQSEGAKCKERCEELATRAAAAEATAAEVQQELRQLQGEHGKCQERCQELANRLEAEAAESAEHATTKERLLQAEVDAAERRLELQRLQEESRGYQERCQQVEVHAASAEEPGSKAELQLEKAVLQERCEQLQQQLQQASAKAEAERSAMLGQLLDLREERGMHKERIRELQHQLCEAKQPEAHQFGGATLGRHGVTFSEAASGGRESDLAEELGYSLVDDVDDVASILSGSSQWSVKQHCFMSDAIFKTCSGDTNFYLMGKNLKKGSQVVAGDGKTLLEVAASPEICPATEVVNLQAGGATLRVTPDHPRASPRCKRRAGQDSLRPGGAAEGRRLRGARLGGSCRAHKGESPGDGVRGAEDRL